MHCTTMFIISNAENNDACISNLIPMNCTTVIIIIHLIPMYYTTMLIISNLIPMHCTTMLIINNAVHKDAYHHKQCSAQVSFSQAMQCTTMLIISNAVHDNAYLKQCSAQLCL